MLATMGYITPEITGKFPGYLSPSAGLKFADIPNGLAAISKVPAAGWGQIVAYAAFCELSQDQSAGTSAAAGDFGWKLLTSSDPEALGATGLSTRRRRFEFPSSTSTHDQSALSSKRHQVPASSEWVVIHEVAPRGFELASALLECGREQLQEAQTP